MMQPGGPRLSIHPYVTLTSVSSILHVTPTCIMPLTRTILLYIDFILTLRTIDGSARYSTLGSHTFIFFTFGFWRNNNSLDKLKSL